MKSFIDEVKTLLSASVTGVTTFYSGEIKLPPRSYCPALMIIPITTKQEAHGTAKDKVTYRVKIRVVVDVTESFAESGTGDTIKAQEQLMDIMEERDANGVALSTSVFGVLRRNIRGTSYLFNNNLEASYETLQRGKFFYAQAEIILEGTTDLVLRS